MYIVDPDSPAPVNSEDYTAASVSALIIDSVDTDRHQLKKFLQKQDYHVLGAKPDQDILALINQEKPGLVFYSPSHTLESDLDLLRRLRELSYDDDRAPYLILTLSVDYTFNISPDKLGGLVDDMCHKPYGESFVINLLKRWKKTKQMQSLLNQQILRLNEYSSQFSEEMDLAANIINNLVQADYLEPGNVRQKIIPMEVLSGDIFLTALNPAGHQVFLVGDLTGHGLPAAVGAMVVYDVFYSMVAKGFPVTVIASEINTKLRRVHNTGRFMCVCLIDLDLQNSFVHVLNAGLPDVILKGQGDGVEQCFKSNNLPLGIVDTPDLDLKLSRRELEHGDRLYVFTDGLTEAQNAKGECFGQQRVVNLFEKQSDYFSTILQQVEEFQGKNRTDDMALIEINVDESRVKRHVMDQAQYTSTPPMPWKLVLELGPEVLQRQNPLPILLQAITELQDMRAHRETIYTVLSEMFSNAVEHGLLGLDSSMKNDVDGFAHYYAKRDSLMKNLESGMVQLEITNRMQGDSAILTMALEHNGKGFHFGKYLDGDKNSNLKMHGRGILLMQRLGSRIRYSKRGRRVEVDFDWSE